MKKVYYTTQKSIDQTSLGFIPSLFTFLLSTGDNIGALILCVISFFLCIGISCTILASSSTTLSKIPQEDENNIKAKKDKINASRYLTIISILSIIFYILSYQNINQTGL